MGRPARARAVDLDALADEACRLHGRAAELREAGALRDARGLARLAVAGMTRAVGARHPDVANLLLELTRIERELGRLRVAERLARRALATIAPFARLRIPEIRRIQVQTIAALAEILVARGTWPEARALYARGLRLAARLGPQDPDRVVLWNGRAMLHKYEGRFEQAAALYARALEATRAHGDPNAEASLLHNLAGLDHARGHFARAERIARRGLARRAAAVGRRHPSFGADLAAYAAILAGLERWAPAKRLYTRAVRILERTAGPDHPDVVHALGNLGAACEATGQLAAARRHYARALASARKTIGPRNVDVAVMLHNMSVLARKAGDAREASRLRSRSLRVARGAVGPRHPRYLELARAAEG